MHVTRRAGRVAAAAVVLFAGPAACTASPDPGAPTTPSVSPSATAARVVVDVRLVGGTVNPNGGKIDVSRGQTVVINVTSDHEDEVHVHGFDIEIPVTAGTPVSKSFVADQLGSVEIESHRPEKIIAIMNVR